jgi:hypothetical protein
MSIEDGARVLVWAPSTNDLSWWRALKGASPVWDREVGREEAIELTGLVLCQPLGEVRRAIALWRADEGAPLRRVVRGLPHQQSVAALQRIQGRTVAQMVGPGAPLGAISPATAEVHLDRARKALGTAFGPDRRSPEEWTHDVLRFGLQALLHLPPDQR